MAKIARFEDLEAWQAQLYVALDLEYLTNEQFQDMFTNAVRVGQMLTKLMQYLRTVKDNV